MRLLHVCVQVDPRSFHIRRHRLVLLCLCGGAMCSKYGESRGYDIYAVLLSYHTDTISMVLLENHFDIGWPRAGSLAHSR